MRIAITGATGNVGTALLRQLAAEPDVEVVGVARGVPGPQAGPPYDRVEWHSVDVGGSDAVPRLTECFSGADAVVHLAWQIQPSHRRMRLHRTNVIGSRQVFDATRAARVPTLVHASSVGAYAPGPKDRFVDERWPVTGVTRSCYSIDKSAVEALLDTVEYKDPGLRVVRMRPALTFQHDAGSEITRYFLGSLARKALRWTAPVIPVGPRLRIQGVHADDVAEAYLGALRRPVRGAFNLAASPVLDGELVAEETDGVRVSVPPLVLRAFAAAAWRLRLQPTEAGWVDLLTSVPLLDCSRAERELAWHPRHDARQALRTLLGGIAEGSGTAVPALRPIHAASRVPGGAKIGVSGSAVSGVPGGTATRAEVRR